MFSFYLPLLEGGKKFWTRQNINSMTLFLDKVDGGGARTPYFIPFCFCIYFSCFVFS